VVALVKIPGLELGPVEPYGLDMTDQSPAVTISHPPDAMLRVVNPVMRFVLGTPFAGPMRKQMMVLSFTGRKSGRPYSIVLSAHVVDDQLFALTGARWKNNFRDGAAAEVLHDGKKTAMRGELVTDPTVVADRAHRCAESYGVKHAQRSMGMAFREQRIPTLEEFTDAAQREHLAIVNLSANLSPAG
jgi:hypothetical protein